MRYQTKYALWDDRVSTKKSINTSPFQFVYRIDATFHVQLGLPILKFMQDEFKEPNAIQRRIYWMIENRQLREYLL